MTLRFFGSYLSTRYGGLRVLVRLPCEHQFVAERAYGLTERTGWWVERRFVRLDGELEGVPVSVANFLAFVRKRGVSEIIDRVS